MPTGHPANRDAPVPFPSVVLRASLGRFTHEREPLSIDHQTVVHANRDMLPSSAAFDLDEGPVTITLPEAGARFMSMIAIDEDRYTVTVIYKPGSYTFSQAHIGTRYLLVGVRTLVNPADPVDVLKVHALQNAVTVRHRQAGAVDVPNWSRLSERRAMGDNPEKDTLALAITPAANDGTTAYRLAVRNVPVDGCWSISVYNRAGYFQPNPLGVYSLNSLAAKKAADGSVIVRFGACAGKVANCLPITPGWRYVVRLYRPRPEIVNGQWTFPDAEIVR